MRVVVIGAGLGGLCLAQGLLGAGAEVDVYERDPGITARFQGYRIGLGEQGRAALLGCLAERLHPLLDATTGDIAGPRHRFDHQLNPVTPWTARTAVMIDRHVLRHLLLAGLDGHVHTAKALVRYEVRPDGRVAATFTDGTVTVADLLVGADGINSAVRGQLTPDTAILDTDVRAVIGRTPLTDRFERLVPGFGTTIEGPDAVLMLGLMKFRTSPRKAAAELAPDVWLPDTEDYVRWVMMASPEHRVDGSSVQEAVLGMMDGWHPDLRAVVETADPDNSTLIAIRVVKPGPRWPAGPVTLLGDAVHATSPSGGNGAGTAFRDADLLRRKLIEVLEGELNLVDALAGYEDQMFDYGTAAVEHSLATLSRFLPAPSR